MLAGSKRLKKQPVVIQSEATTATHAEVTSRSVLAEQSRVPPPPMMQNIITRNLQQPMYLNHYPMPLNQTLMSLS